MGPISQNFILEEKDDRNYVLCVERRYEIPEKVAERIASGTENRGDLEGLFEEVIPQEIIQGMDDADLYKIALQISHGYVRKLKTEIFEKDKVKDGEDEDLPF